MYFCCVVFKFKKEHLNLGEMFYISFLKFFVVLRFSNFRILES